MVYTLSFNPPELAELPTKCLQQKGATGSGASIEEANAKDFFSLRIGDSRRNHNGDCQGEAKNRSHRFSPATC